MKLVVFGLSVSSSWGNGHATLWRGLVHALARKGHSVTFYERDVPYYREHRDCFGLPNGELRLYDDFATVRASAAAAVREADIGMVTSYCPDALAATELVCELARTSAFYDLDSPITLDRVRRGEPVQYIGEQRLRPFDIVISYAGGPALRQLQQLLGARRVAALYGSVDTALHSPTAPVARYRADLSYLGTYAAERQAALDALFLEPARLSPGRRFMLGGSGYPRDFAWSPNLHFLHHVPPCEHAAFYGSARLDLNVTRAPMAEMGYCPSGRLFEAAASGGALISDAWPGIDEFYTPDEELLVARDHRDVLCALEQSDDALRAMALRARERTLAQHSVDLRAAQLVDILDSAHAPAREFEREAQATPVEI
jgi:spore maturation protein CgeB